jgi:hypothetical protein
MDQATIFENFVTRAELNTYKRKVQAELAELKEMIKESTLGKVETKIKKPKK